MDIPIINMKNGNTRSVGVNPFHSAWRNGAYIPVHEPGLFTNIIPAMVMPRKISSDNNLLEEILADAGMLLIFL